MERTDLGADLNALIADLMERAQDASGSADVRNYAIAIRELLAARPMMQTGGMDWLRDMFREASAPGPSPVDPDSGNTTLRPDNTNLGPEEAPAHPDRDSNDNE